MMNDTSQPTAAEGRKGFVFFLSWAECLEGLRPTERAAVYDALIQYAQTGEVPQLQGKCKLALSFMLRDFDRQDAKYQRTIERRREAGKKHKGNQYSRKMEQNGTKWNKK